jgi:uncharacterized protein (DUF2267 family)
MPWKKSADGKSIEIGEDGNPIFVYPETSEEASVKFDDTLKKIKELNTEAKTHRLKASELEAKLNEINEKYGSIDIEQAKEALKTLKALDKGELMTASKVKDFESQLRKEIASAYEGRIQDMTKTFETEKQKFTAEIEQREREISNNIINQYLQNSIEAGALHKKTDIQDTRLAMGYLGDRIRVENENGKRRLVVLNWNSDRPIMSSKPEKAGEPAEFEEALYVLFSTDPLFDRVAKKLPGGPGSTGGGGKGGPMAMSTVDFYKEIFEKAGQSR